MKKNVAKRTLSAVTAIATLPKDKVEDTTVNAGAAMMIDVATMSDATPGDAMTDIAMMTTAITMTTAATINVLHPHVNLVAMTNVLASTTTAATNAITLLLRSTQHQ